MDDHSFFSDYETQVRTETYRNAGAYKIRFYYNSNSEDINRFGGRFSGFPGKDSAQVYQLFEKAAKVELMSNEITITFVK